ncbi:MAG: hypothetical protein WCX48_06965 [Bacteroidales bacterium]
MKKLSEQAKNNIRNASLFVLGVVVTIFITKFSDKIFPGDPVIVKEVTDTIKIVHNYDIPPELDNDSIRLELERKLKNLELLNNYDKQIKERIVLTKKNDGVVPNLILTSDADRIKSKGYMYGSSSAYFTSDCPTLDKEFIDIKVNFINPSITREIAFLRINIYRFDNPDSNEARTYVLEELFEVKSDGNLIRISNDIGKGKYEILYGFVFKGELTKTYPTFNFKRCIVTK